MCLLLVAGENFDAVVIKQQQVGFAEVLNDEPV